LGLKMLFATRGVYFIAGGQIHRTHGIAGSTFNAEAFHVPGTVLHFILVNLFIAARADRH